MASFDIVGDIAIIKYREGIDCIKIGNEILKKHKNIKNVAVDYGVEGDYRIRKIKLILGNTTETIHREFGIRIKVDISKVYFSPRLATERWRVVQDVKDGETIFDMFAGCGPFSIMIAKYRDVKIYSCDINLDAIEYLKENIKLNKVKGIFPILGDSREVIENIPRVDRIIMNLPHKSYEYLPYALKKIKRGGKINYYELLNKENNRKKDLYALADKNGEKINIENMHVVHEYSPSKAIYSFIIKII